MSEQDIKITQLFICTIELKDNKRGLREGEIIGEGQGASIELIIMMIRGKRDIMIFKVTTWKHTHTRSIAAT